VVSLGVGGGGLLGVIRVGFDLGVDFSEEFFEALDLGGFKSLLNSRELEGESFRVVGLQFFHVVINVNSENSISVDLGFVFGVITINGVSGESLGVVGNIETSISGSLKGSEDSVSDGGVGKSNIKNSLERSSFSLVFFNAVVFSVNSGGSRVQLFEGSFFKKSSSTEQSSGISGSVVGERRLESKSFEFR